MHFLFRVFQKYGNLKYVDDDFKQMANFLLATHHLPILNLALEIIQLTSEMYIDSKVLSYTIKICSQSSMTEAMRPHIEPHMNTLITKFCIPFIMATPQDLEEFESNPVEHIRSQHDVTFAFFSAKSAALDMINYFTSYKSQGELFERED
jgi:hypothetical protein